MSAPDTEQLAGANPWNISSPVGIVAICVATLFLGLLGIAASIGRSSFSQNGIDFKNVSARDSQELVLPDGQQMAIKGLESCSGMKLNDQISVVLDPDDCDIAAIGREISLTKTGPIDVDADESPLVLIPDSEGNIGVLQNIDGVLALLPPSFGDDDSVIKMWSPDGESVRFDRPDDSQAPGSLQPSEGLLYSADSSERFDFSTPQQRSAQGEENEANQSEIEFDAPNLSRFVPPLSIVAFIAIAGLVGYFYRTRLRRQWFPNAKPRRPKPTAAPSSDTVGPDEQVDIIDQLLWEIDQESDPRKAIQRVYAAVESGLGNSAMARQPAETPALYLSRVFGRSDQAQPPLAKLTQLFEVARFSVNPVTEAMRQESIDALQTLRSEFARIALENEPDNDPEHDTDDLPTQTGYSVASEQGLRR